jgi:carbon monoxide dehydrogenase subunit G
MFLLTPHDDGRATARRLLFAAMLAVGLTAPGAYASPLPASEPAPDVTVSEAGGVYSVVAHFDVAAPMKVALEVLSDYERIPKFMPGVRSSVVLERSPGRLLVEQEAVSRLLLFSKKVHLVLEVTEEDNVIRFVDRSGKSFTSYRGSWHAQSVAHGTRITYALEADPAFEVPEFILRRLLRRDSAQMIGALQDEIASRAR